MRLTPCDQWADPDVVALDNRICVPEGSGESPPDLTEYVERATEAMWVITGRRFGVCTTTVRPVRGSCCECSPRCACGEGIALHTPIVSVDEVLIDGEAFTDYHIRNNRSIHRNDHRSWPTRQDLGLPTSAADTFAITYTYGVAPPLVVTKATAELAVQYWLLDQEDAYCKLPMGTVKVTRQGLTVDMERALESSSRIITDAVNSYPMGAGMPSDAWFDSPWDLVLVSA